MHIGSQINDERKRELDSWCSKSSGLYVSRDIRSPGSALLLEDYELVPRDGESDPLFTGRHYHTPSPDDAIENPCKLLEEQLRIVLMPFSELQAGEHVGVREYTQRFALLKRAGYEVGNGSVSKLSLKEARKAYCAFKEDLVARARKRCPATHSRVVQEVRECRERQKELN